MIELVGLALALAMDAFAVSLAQGVMPLIGWGLGTAFAGWIEAFDHWIAFALLSLLGLNMLRAACDETQSTDTLAGWALFVAAIATSIDAAVAGITLPLFGVPVLLAGALIGGVTAALCLIAGLGGARLGRNLGSRAEIAGGILLIALGVKILAEHLPL